jgi:hypothetical protein
VVLLLGQAGEWVGAWLEMSITFLVASLGVVGLGWWVLRGDARNRAAETKAENAAKPDHEESPSKAGH